jgi:hypothetical protein
MKRPQIEICETPVAQAASSATGQTPGPWFACKPEGSNGYWYVGTHRAERDDVCVLYTQDNIEANARLIAEAGTVATETGLTPRQLADQRKELLEALQLVLDCDYDSERKIGDVPAIQSVLAKVEGCQ